MRRVSFVFEVLFNMSSTLALSIFVIKYYIASLRIKEVMQGGNELENEGKINRRAKVIFYSQLLLILIGSVFYGSLEV